LHFVYIAILSRKAATMKNPDSPLAVYMRHIAHANNFIFKEYWTTFKTDKTMNNNSISTIVEQQTITSKEIAEITGKNHFDVLRAIRKMEPAWEETAASKFTCSSYKDKSGKMSPLYIMTKRECLFVATKFNDVARAKLVLRWEQLEKERLTQQPATQPQPKAEAASGSSVPVDPRNMSRLQILQLALQAEEENERLRLEKKELEDERAVMQDGMRSLEADKLGLMIENGHKDQKIQQLEQRTAYLDVIMADSSTVTVTQIAQDYGQGAPSFNKLLNGLGIQRKVGGQWVLYADHLNKGYVATRMIPIHHSDGPDTYKPMTAWTQAGRRFIYERLKRNGIPPLIERNRQQAPAPAPATGNGQRGGVAV